MRSPHKTRHRHGRRGAGRSRRRCRRECVGGVGAPLWLRGGAPPPRGGGVRPRRREFCRLVEAPFGGWMMREELWRPRGADDTKMKVNETQ